MAPWAALVAVVATLLNEEDTKAGRTRLPFKLVGVTVAPAATLPSDIAVWSVLGETFGISTGQRPNLRLTVS